MLSLKMFMLDHKVVLVSCKTILNQSYKFNRHIYALTLGLYMQKVV